MESFKSVAIFPYSILRVSLHVISDHQFDFSQSATSVRLHNYVGTRRKNGCN